jgi:hypothetical protein
MYLVIDELKIENRHLTGVIMDSDRTIMFQGRAIEDEGKRICEELSKFQKGQIVEVEAEFDDYRLWEGICKVTNIGIQTPELASPMAKELIYRFYGELEPIT